MPPRAQTKSKSKPKKPKKSAPHIHVEGGVVHRGKGAKKDAKASAKKSKRKPVLTRKGADRHELYQLAVQSPEEDCKFFARVYRKMRGKDARHFREDFCGTALNCSQWLRRHKKNTAEGFDIDPDPVGWGVERNFEPLGEEASRCTLHLKDVREPSKKRPDVRTATNFSYFCFKKRSELLEYFRSACKDLKRDGVFILDIYGGPDAMHEMLEEREIEEGYTYVWDQDKYSPATGDYRTYIHFQFPDGTEWKRAFRYEWRLWSLPEVIDVLRDAGFAKIDTYWEGTDADGESGNGIYTKHKRGENCEAWVTYVVCQK